MNAIALNLAGHRPTPREQPDGIVPLDAGREGSSTNRMQTIGAWSARAICLTMVALMLAIYHCAPKQATAVLRTSVARSLIAATQGVRR